MLEFFSLPIAICLVYMGGYCAWQEWSSTRYLKKSRKRREIFFEAMERKHNYVCVDGHSDKTLRDFILEVWIEQGSITEDRPRVLDKEGWGVE